MSRAPTLSVVQPTTPTPAEAAMQLQQQAKAAAQAATTDLLDSVRRAAIACESSQDIDAVAIGIRNEARVLAAKVRQALATMETIRGRG